MKTKFFHLIVSALLLSGTLVAQQPLNRCGTMDMFKQQSAQDISFLQRRMNIEKNVQQWISDNQYTANKTNAVITIPVVIHVVYNTAAQNISDAQIQSQIDVLNEDYSMNNADKANTPAAFASVAVNTGIQFCLAKRDPKGNATTGITRTSTNVTSFAPGDGGKVFYTAQGGTDIWDRDKYLNLYVCNMMSSGFIGFASMPGTIASADGAMFDYRAFGRTGGSFLTYYDKGRTVTHEIGHWLDLWHPWGDDGGACSGDDYCADTPNQAGSLYNCQSFPLTDACSPKSPGVMFMNFMEYVPDACMNLFTKNQSDRMNALLNTYRASLKTSQGCVAPGAVAPVANFSISNVSPLLGKTISFTNSSTGTITSYSWNFGTNATPTTASTAGPHSVSYSTLGTKTISLTVTGAGGSNTVTKTITVSATPTDIYEKTIFPSLVTLCPNPSDGKEIFINLNGAIDNNPQISVSVYDIVGRKMYFTSSYYGNNEVILKFSPQLPSGMYIFEMGIKNDKFIRKLIVD